VIARVKPEIAAKNHDSRFAFLPFTTAGGEIIFSQNIAGGLLFTGMTLYATHRKCVGAASPATTAPFISIRTEPLTH
jgi:hypothetical protein